MAGLVVEDAYIIRHVFNLPYGTDSTRLRQTLDDFINHSNGAMLRTVFVFEPLLNRFLQVLLLPGAKRMEWTTVSVVDEVDLKTAIEEYQSGRGSRPFPDGELMSLGRVYLNSVGSLVY
jgi:hypothetical protein